MQLVVVSTLLTPASLMLIPYVEVVDSSYTVAVLGWFKDILARTELERAAVS